MKDINQILFSTYHYKIHFWLHFFYYQAIGRVFLKALQNLLLQIAVSLVIFTDLAKSHLILKNQYVRKLISIGYICRITLNTFAEITSLVSIILNILRKCNLTYESQIYKYLRKYFSGKHFKAFVQKPITVCIFHGVTTDFRKTII